MKEVGLISAPGEVREIESEKVSDENKIILGTYICNINMLSDLNIKIYWPIA